MLPPIPEESQPLYVSCPQYLLYLKKQQKNPKHLKQFWYRKASQESVTFLVTEADLMEQFLNN